MPSSRASSSACLAIVTVEILARVTMVRVNGWVTAFGCGLPDTACSRGPRTPASSRPDQLPQEAILEDEAWTARASRFSGAHDYVMHFPPGGLPPSGAFWSLTMADATERFVANPISQPSSATARASWPTRTAQWTSTCGTRPRQGMRPTGCPRRQAGSGSGCGHLPGAAILDGTYTVPPVVRVGRDA
ncbi:MAG: DUF1214 domain-containing protein [Vicinamibacterales bacterium]